MIIQPNTDKLALAKKLLECVRQKARRVSGRLGRPIRFMEVCGTHTAAISRLGLRDALQEVMILASGPGCPVCVTDYQDIDTAVAVCRTVDNVVVATFGDMIKVPGSYSSLEKEKAGRGNVKIFYAPYLAVEYARNNPDKEVVFLAVGFETTMPTVALALDMAERDKVNNFSILPLGKLVPPAIKALLQDPELNVDGLILPGHVSAVIGRKSQDFIASYFHMPAVVTGFEAADILIGINSLLKQLETGAARVENRYRRVVAEEGNPEARQITDKYFAPVSAKWRGLGSIPDSGLVLRERYGYFDAGTRFSLEGQEPIIPRGCLCGDLLKGKALPADCRLFGKTCTPLNPVGPCMVSSEGACAAWFNYGMTS